tara:strand:+ start:162 stop:458 length:297 start_codon:yes stop_codon:yes gene_type:complete
MKVSFGHIGSSLGTRVIGRKIREDVSSTLTRGEFVCFDFGGVETISHSFADECFGKLLLDFDIDFLRKHSTFINTNKIISTAISFTLKERANQLLVSA